MARELKSKVSTVVLGAILTCLFSSNPIFADPLGPLRIRKSGGAPELYLTERPIAPMAGMAYDLMVEHSADLQNWEELKPLVPGPDAAAPLSLSPGSVNSRYFRLRNRGILSTGKAAEAGESFGFNSIFADELQRIGYPTTAEFVQLAGPLPEYLPQIQFDPTTARFWDLFNTDPAVHNASLPPGSGERRLYDFRLNPTEMALFKTNGFVVSPRLGGYSFADVYYRIFTDDLPVFISTDSILHAWHWSYQAMLSELEEVVLGGLLDRVLSGMASQIPDLASRAGTETLAQGVKDADYFIAVTRSLLTGTNEIGSLGQEPSIVKTVNGVRAGIAPAEFKLWGNDEYFDFSQFTVRGHYTRTPALGRYFQAVMWASRAGFRYAGSGSTLREFAGTVALHEACERAGRIGNWMAFDDIVRLHMGHATTLTLRELGAVRAALNLTFSRATNDANLREAQQNLVTQPFGVQAYASATYPSPAGPSHAQLPRLFAFTPQREIPDGWCTAAVTFDRIQWPTRLPFPGWIDGKVVRRLPIGLDVAFGALGNRPLAPDIAAGIDAEGLPYHHNLLAVARSIDNAPEALWEESIYSRWLRALRQLSKPTTGPAYPQAMRTRAWMHKTVNTQLASWTQLRHDTVLYAAQPYTGIILCEYPAGFVEPVPDFWEAMRKLADSTAAALSALPVNGFSFNYMPPGGSQLYKISARERVSAQQQLCQYFAGIMAQLRDMAQKELASQPFSESETQFIRGVMNSPSRPYFGKTYDGWYPFLFYEDYGQSFNGAADINSSDRVDRLVTDVHSAPPDAFFDGAILHEGVGDVDLLLIAVDNGPDKMVYAGPTLSHYEFATQWPVRLQDSQFVPSADKRPRWVRDYLVP